MKFLHVPGDEPQVVGPVDRGYLYARMLAIEVDTSLPALRVVRVLEKLSQERGLSERIVICHGTEFPPKTLDQWVYEHNVKLHFITPGTPMEGGYIESFHGKFREECLNEHWLLTLDDARETIEEWRLDYNRGAPSHLVGLPDTAGIRNRLRLNVRLNSNPSALTYAD